MANLTVTPYLSFCGRCEEALEFYKKSLGATIDMMMRFSENPEPDTHGCIPEGFGDKIMHVTFRIGDTLIMASDGGQEQDAEFKGFSLSLQPDSEEKAKELFAALSEEGQVTMPLAKMFWTPCFGMVTDKFGVSWMVNVV